MLTFLTLLLGIVWGPRAIELSAPVGTAAVEIFLDGESVGLKAKAPWTFVCNLGPAPAPHSLDAVARDARGAEIGRARLKVNVPAAPGRSRSRSPARKGRNGPHRASRLGRRGRKSPLEGDRHLRRQAPRRPGPRAHRAAGVRPRASPLSSGRRGVRLRGARRGGDHVRGTRPRRVLPRADGRPPAGPARHTLRSRGDEGLACLRRRDASRRRGRGGRSLDRLRHRRGRSSLPSETCGSGRLFDTRVGTFRGDPEVRVLSAYSEQTAGSRRRTTCIGVRFRCPSCAG